jgi:hypothetical protein
MYNVSEATDELLRIYRHDFLNVLQVVGGLAQLHKTDRLLTYIRKASDEVQQFGRFISCGDPRLALMLYETLLQDSPGNYLLFIKGNVPLLTEQSLENAQKILAVLQRSLQYLNESTLSITLSAEDVPAVAVRVQCDELAPDFWHKVLEAVAENGLNGSIDKENAELLLCLDNPSIVREQ